MTVTTDKMEATDRIIFGLDLGQSQDYSAIAGIEVKQNFRKDLFKGWAEDGDSIILVRYLKRWPLGTSYPTIVDEVTSTLQKIKGRPELVIDFTGVGRPVFDMFKDKRLHPKGISIHGGMHVSKEGTVYNVPKRDLVGALQVLYQNGRIKISGALPEKKQLNHELLNFKVRISESGHDTYEAWREKDHDDIVLAVACACWMAQKKRKVKACRPLPGH